MWREYAARLTGVFGGRAAEALRFPAAQRATAPELDCLAGLIAPNTLEAARLRARKIGVSTERVLIAMRVIDEELYLRTLASHLGLVFDTLNRPRAACPLTDGQLIDAPAAGLMPLIEGGRCVFVAAPHDAGQFAALVLERPGIEQFLRLTSSRRLEDYAFSHANIAAGEAATMRLRNRYREMSAASGYWPATGWRTVTAALALAVAAVLAPIQLASALEIALAVVFLGWIVLRLVGLLMRPPRRRPLPPIPDRELPVYSIVVALYREAASARRLVRALEQINYPREKLDIKLVLEQDDLETRTVLARMNLGPEFDIIVAPAIGPRTKPKALNVALPLLRGCFVAVYDAEDRPDPDQLRQALAAFRAQRRDLACVQARLTIDNTADSWLAGVYTAEYAAQFDVFLPALAALSAPLPLGGTSNHFRTAVLRKVGGWDSFNVTEDADLGIRLARLGYRSDVIASATYEEAPARFSPWLKQRTRWFKGWMHTVKLQNIQ